MQKRKLTEGWKVFQKVFLPISAVESYILKVFNVENSNHINHFRWLIDTLGHICHECIRSFDSWDNSAFQKCYFLRRVVLREQLVSILNIRHHGRIFYFRIVPIEVSQTLPNVSLLILDRMDWAAKTWNGENVFQLICARFGALVMWGTAERNCDFSGHSLPVFFSVLNIYDLRLWSHRNTSISYLFVAVLRFPVVKNVFIR